MNAIEYKDRDEVITREEICTALKEQLTLEDMQDADVKSLRSIRQNMGNHHYCV